MKLLDAIQTESLEKIQEIVGSKNIPINSKWLDYIALNSAIECGRIDVAKFLLEKQCRVNKTSKSTESANTPLHHSIKLGNLDLISSLLDKKASVRAVNPDGDTPLHIAFITRQEKIVDAILEHIENTSNYDNVKNSQGLTHMHIACTRKNEKIVKNYVEAGADLNDAMNADLFDTRELTLFHAAYIAIKDEIVKMFLKEGMDVNHTIEPFSNIYGGCTPLHFAIHFKCHETIYLLLKFGANVDAQDCKGNTPLHCAVTWIENLNYSKLEEDIILSLISAGAKLHAINLAGESPIEKIMDTKKVVYKNRLLENLLKYRCFVNIFDKRSKQGYIAKAIKNEHNIKNIMKNPLFAMVMKAPDMNKSDEMNCTPIHNIVAIRKLNASCKIYIKAIHALIKLGFNIDQLNSIGESALRYAVEFQNSKAVVALLALGADINGTRFPTSSPFFFNWVLTRKIKKEPSLSMSVVHRILRELQKHVCKLQLVNLPVNDVDRTVEADMISQFPLSTKMIEQCQVELERLDRRKINSRGITLFSFLSETGAVTSYPHMLSQDREAVDNLFQNRNFHLLRDFPEFSGILQMQYKKAKDRVQLIQDAKNSFNNLTEYILPDLCCFAIFKFLKNEDLENLIAWEKEFMIPPQTRCKIESEVLKLILKEFR